MDEAISSVVLLIGLAVGVDYSMFYLRREREERAAGARRKPRSRRRRPPPAARCSCPGITVIAAMAGMYFGGAATFISFATGTIMVVAIAVIGSLTVLPAVLSKLGDRVNKGRVPFLQARAAHGRAARLVVGARPRAASARWSRRSRRPACCVVLAIPVLHIHTADTGVDGLPRSIADHEDLRPHAGGVPGRAVLGRHRGPGRQPGQGSDLVARRSSCARSRVTRISSTSRSRSTSSPDRKVAVIEVPLAGSGSDDTSLNAVKTLRSDVVPQVLAERARAARSSACPASAPARSTSTS